MALRSESIARGKATAFVQLPELDGHSRKVYALGFNCDGSMLASGSNDRSIRIWDPFTERELMELRGHSDSILSLAWDPTTPNRLASTGSDKTVRFWDTRTGRIVNSVSLPSDAANIAYSHDAKYVVVGSLDCITLIDTRKARVVRRVVNPFQSYEMQFSKTGYLFVAAGHAAGFGTFEIMRVVAEKKGNPNLESAHKVMAHAGSCVCLDLHPSGRFLALGGLDSLVSIWDLEELYCVKTFVVTTSSIRSVRFSHDGKYIAISMDDPNLIVVDVESGEKVVKLQLQNNVQYLSWHPTKNVLAYVGDKASSDKNSNRDGVIKLIEMKE
ncbi:Anaphase-promoting complex subunit 4 WD40 domain [Phytophthora infestans]|uniref:Anaphase-promoting complex subunit 4 WD40 domain n=1 Tax=Phytophthora infestans TaxID=4787 RepID=A0A833WMF3_PHYIN|nr:Anaphase-promoting complex subunit 4 WD40 domain [Phytophthora infestans]KAF4137848.1 Anaphase-promoting complex subunit 4 WD40 domain [Phytophthora infestans]